MKAHSDEGLCTAGNAGSGMHHSFNAPNSTRNTTSGVHGTVLGQAASNISSSLRNASALPLTSGLSALANATNITSGLASLSNATNITSASGVSRLLPGAGTRDQRISDSFNAVATGEDLTPAQIAELDEEYEEFVDPSSIRVGASTATTAQQRGGASLTGTHGSSQARNSTVLGSNSEWESSTTLSGGSSTAHSSSAHPGAGTAANPGLLDRQRADSGVVRIPADEVSDAVGLRQQGQGEGKERQSGIGLGGQRRGTSCVYSAVGDKMQLIFRVNKVRGNKPLPML